MNNKTITFAILFIIVLGIVVYGFVGGFCRLEQDHSLNSQQATDKLRTFLSQRLSGQAFEVKNLKKEKGLYQATISLSGQNLKSYMSTDGSLFFPQVMSMNAPENKSIPQKDTPEVDLFIMSFCTYGNQAENIMKPVVDLLGKEADINLHYIIYSNYGSAKNCLSEEQKYCSLHGVAEVKQDIRELCVAQDNSQKLWDFVTTINSDTDVENVEQDWSNIAQQVGLDVNKISSCQQEQGLSLLKQEMSLTTQKYPVQKPSQHNNQEKVLIQGSPTLVINGMIYDGQRSSQAYKEAICSAFTEAPQECNQQIDGVQAGASGSCD